MQLLLLLLLRLFIFFFLLLKAPFMAVSLNQEGLLLQRVKLSLDDPFQALSNWNPNDSTPCNWFGVTCSDPSLLSVTSIDLFNANLSGPFPILVCSLPSLSFLSLSFNYISGSLPPSISTCRNLTHLDLSENLLVGELPSSLPSLSKLLYLDLSANNFLGSIPQSFATFQKLQSISLVANVLNGTLPPFLGEIAPLKQLNLSYNSFEPSPIPPEYGNLTQLEVLWLAGCNLIGSIPPTLGNLKKLLDLDLEACWSLTRVRLRGNRLSGEVPGGLWGLPHVSLLELSDNSLSSEISPKISSALNLSALLYPITGSRETLPLQSLPPLQSPPPGSSAGSSARTSATASNPRWSTAAAALWRSPPATSASATSSRWRSAPGTPPPRPAGRLDRLPPGDQHPLQAPLRPRLHGREGQASDPK